MSGNSDDVSGNAGNPADDVGAIDNGAIGPDSGAPKRRRGRPRRDDNGGVDVIDPSSLGGSAAGDGGGTDSGGSSRRRGRKPGTSSRAKAVPLDLNTLILALSAAQITAFKLTEVPEVVLTPDQNENLAAALSKVMRHFPMVVSEKTADISALVFVAGNIAFTQFALYSQRKQQGQPAR